LILSGSKSFFAVALRSSGVFSFETTAAFSLFDDLLMFYN